MSLNDPFGLLNLPIKSGFLNIRQKLPDHRLEKSGIFFPLERSRRHISRRMTLKELSHGSAPAELRHWLVQKPYKLISVYHRIIRIKDIF